MMVWNCAISFLFFRLMKTLNKLRVGQVYELYGMDTLESIKMNVKQSEMC